MAAALLDPWRTAVAVVGSVDRRVQLEYVRVAAETPAWLGPSVIRTCALTHWTEAGRNAGKTMKFVPAGTIALSEDRRIASDLPSYFHAWVYMIVGETQLPGQLVLPRQSDMDRGGETRATLV